jgi:hypothetical protein
LLTNRFAVSNIVRKDWTDMPLSRSTLLLLPWLSALALASSCAHGSHYRRGGPGYEPEAELEAQLLSRSHQGNQRSGDGMLFYAEFDAVSPESLRVPHDTLALQCENRGGSWQPLGPPQAAASSLTPPDGFAPDPIHAALQDADQRGLFGEFVCGSELDVWSAEIQPRRLLPAKAPARYRLELYVHAAPGGEGEPAGELPPPPAGPPAGELPPPSAAGEPPPNPAGIKALDPQPSRPTAQGDQLLADPHPFGVVLGEDSPDALARKLELDSAADSCSEPAPRGLSRKCWQHPGGSQASSVSALFADLGHGPVIAELDVRYPADAYAWLTKQFSEAYGPADEHSAEATRWSWLHTIIAVTTRGGETDVQLTHKPTLDRAERPATSASAAPPGPVRIATPLQMQLGYEPALAAQAKLTAAGFQVADRCSDGGPAARPVFTRTCSLRGNTPGLRSAWVRIVDIGDGRPRLAELGYHYDTSALEATERDLEAQYGAPIPSEGGIRQWWTGPVGIALTPSADGFTLRYFHGRLLQIFMLAAAKQQAAAPH